MTSVLPEEESRVVKLKQKLMNDVRGKEEVRSFLSFSRENLSISQSELEQGFNKPWFRPRRHTVLSVLALAIAVLCLGLETWKLRCSLTNARQIEELKRDVETLKHRFLQQDLLDELKAFEEQLYAGEPSDEDDDDDDTDDDDDDDDDDGDPGEADIENADYDIAYDVGNDDSSTASSERHMLSSAIPDPPPFYPFRPSDFPDHPSTNAPVPSPPDPPGADKAVMKLLTAVRKAEVKHGQEPNARDGGHRNAEKDRHLEELDHKKSSEEQRGQPKLSTKRKRDVPGTKETLSRLQEWRAAVKQKRNLDDHGTPKKPSRTRHVRARHSSKRHFSHFPSGNQDDSDAENYQAQPMDSPKGLQVSGHALAAHYSADSKLPGVSDCRHRCRNCNLTAVGQCHRDRIFTAWRATDWMHGALMDQHFNMHEDGSLIIPRDGLYLVYAQIHYVDTVHAAGFRLEVNNRVILQCSVARTGTKIDQSCFSAQVTLLRKNDSLSLKEIEESPRGAILEDIDSFLGVVKLGDIHMEIP